MSFDKDGFLRCYFEAWLLWLGGNVFIGLVDYFRAKFARELAPRPFDFVENLTDPIFLVANALLVVLFASVLIGHRRPSGTTN